MPLLEERLEPEAQHTGDHAIVQSEPQLVGSSIILESLQEETEEVEFTLEEPKIPMCLVSM